MNQIRKVTKKKTKIVCTMGPATEDDKVLRQLILNGMNVARFNFSHGSHEYHRRNIERVRALSKELNIPIAIMLDTKGPEIRTGELVGHVPVTLEAGARVVVTTRVVQGTSEVFSVDYDNLPNEVKIGSSILLSDGLIALTVEKIDGHDIYCKVINGGKLGEKKGVNLPDVDVQLPSVTEQDRADIMFGCEFGVDAIAASFIRNAAAVEEIRNICSKSGAPDTMIFSKIESSFAVKNFDEILAASDGIMVARGDLGVEVPMEEVPVYQKHIIHLAEIRGKIVVTATQMLDSMMHNPRPTRAEATDVANAIYDGTTAIMLSGETASGAYPVEAVKTMSRIAEAAENDINYRHRFMNRPLEVGTDITTAISHSTCMVAQDIGAKAIVTVTMSGFTARRISKYKPTCPIVACSVSEAVACQMNLLFGVIPLNIPQEDNEEGLFEAAVIAAKKAGVAEKGDKIVLTAGVPLGETGNTNMIRVFEVF